MVRRPGQAGHDPFASGPDPLTDSSPHSSLRQPHPPERYRTRDGGCCLCLWLETLKPLMPWPRGLVFPLSLDLSIHLYAVLLVT